MRYWTIPGEIDAVVWLDDAGNSGVIRSADTTAWADYLAWQHAGNAPAPMANEVEPTLEQARTVAATRLNAAVDREMVPLLMRYPMLEVASWPPQLAAAQAWLADPSTPTPMIDAMLAGRDKAELCEAIVAHGEAYAVRTGQVLGWRYQCSAWIDACEDVEALTNWPPTYPDVPDATH
jgi:hypothetical protein